ncbi:MAG: tRNA (N(6)-L-threonylcarbamoyladenosine(37)-C(2))-methylthiotransferase MtaB [Acidobacteria bacterium]|nr:tRNA (N(6)-L-threonylcarbamoyladenosine(37)-C(2))-methylthiotransferase MtaB [Acidobacteriota bacterium]MBI3655847.1 tRNA (N(6)-L-threonylcarbamoyladenosine(37)-C(2))-methylthiotransferase MtaB [Acidobacteriota bacterium]
MPTFHIATFGCRANQADSAVIREDLRCRRLEETATSAAADVIIVNSCTVTQSADHQVRQLIRKMHRDNPKAKIIVTGCYAQRRPHELAQIDGVDVVMGNSYKGSLGDILKVDGPREDELYGGSVRVHHSDIPPENVLAMAPAMDIGEKTRPFLKIQDGCDAQCSFCIIPAVRGKARSARPDEVVAQIRTLAEQGYQEVVLTGINLGTFGWKLERPTSLSALVSRILAETSLPRLRLGSIEPMKFSHDLIELMASCDRVAPHFHLPLQSGSNRILRLMKRPYRAERYLQIVESIRRKIPYAGIGADVIAGFPGETDAEFEETYRRIQDSPLTYLHVFTYSPREGTWAAQLADVIPEKVALARSRRLRKLSAEKHLEFRRQFIGHRLSALTLSEGEAAHAGAYLMALSGNYLKVRVPGAVRSNEIIDVTIAGVTDDALEALPYSQNTRRIAKGIVSEPYGLLDNCSTSLSPTGS